MKPTRPLGIAVVAALALSAPHARAFTQESPVTSGGHEWITVFAALEALAEPLPRKEEMMTDKGAAVSGSVGLMAHVASKLKIFYKTNSSRLDQAERKLLTTGYSWVDWPKKGKGSYGARHFKIWSAVMGQRWVDLGGFSLVNASHCWEAITQMADSLQPDHFLRRRADEGPEGAARAIEASRAAFKRYFIEAVMADPEDKHIIAFRDGGAVQVKHYYASKAYFLFGRAAHLFQDSFSPEHGIRTAADHFQKVHDIKSYVCTKGALGHTHAKPLNAKHGDIIWTKAIDFFRSFDEMKPYSIAAIQAMRDLWLAFLKARDATGPGTLQKRAERYANFILAKWFSYDKARVGRFPGVLTAAEQPACDKAVGWPEIATTARHECVAKLKPLRMQAKDSQLLIPFSWQWEKPEDEKANKPSLFKRLIAKIPWKRKEPPHPVETGVQ